MVQFIFILQTAQNCDGILHSRLIHKNLLETTLQGGILFDILSVFIKGGCTDAVQFTAGK